MHANDHYNPPAECCYFCKNTEFSSHSEARYWGEFPLHFVQCNRCHLIFANPMPNLQTVFAGNRALNILHTSRGTFSQYRGGKEFSFFLQKIKPEGVLLDIGCAEGFFLLGVQENSSWKAEGLEIIESAVAFAQNRLGLAVHHGTLESLKNRESHFDFIRMNNVIEHVQDPIKFLRKTWKLLKPGGQIYCSTPNGVQDGHFLKTANKRGIQFNLLENHFFYYHPSTLRQMFQACGLKVIRHYCEDISHSLNDFGLLPWFKYSKENQVLKLSDYRGQSNTDFDITDEEIQSYKNHPQFKNWQLRLTVWQKNLFRLKFPVFLPLGHQQHIFAVKKQ